MTTIAQQEIIKAPEAWEAGIIKIGAVMEDKEQVEQAADAHLDNLYAFGTGTVLFKPTRAADIQFRLDRKSAKSYFIGGDPDHA